MPIYEFKCRGCSHQFEALCRMGSNGRGLACPRCSGKRLQRLMSTFSARSAGKAPAGAGASASACSSCSSRDCSTCG